MHVVLSLWCTVCIHEHYSWCVEIKVLYVVCQFLFATNHKKTPIVSSETTVHKTIYIYIRYSNNKTTQSFFCWESNRQQITFNNNICAGSILSSFFRTTVLLLHCLLNAPQYSNVQNRNGHIPYVDYDWTSIVNYRSDLCTSLSFSFTQIIYIAVYHVIFLDVHIHAHTLSCSRNQ